MKITNDLIKDNNLSVTECNNLCLLYGYRIDLNYKIYCDNRMLSLKTKNGRC